MRANKSQFNSIKCQMIVEIKLISHSLPHGIPLGYTVEKLKLEIGH
jgi:hypothetical protein